MKNATIYIRKFKFSECYFPCVLDFTRLIIISESSAYNLL